MGFITGQAVRPKKGAAYSIKFPDLVSVRDDVCLWWEFKAVGSRTLHPGKAGGTFVKDVYALCGFSLEETSKYLKGQLGQLSKARSRDDSSYIGASKLGDKICSAKEHVGVALIFAPGEEALECSNPKATERHWWPAKRIDELRAELAASHAASCVRELTSLDTPNRGQLRRVALDGRTSAGEGGSVEGAVPRWAGWLVSMGSWVTVP